MNTATDTTPVLALTAMPWATLNRPSIQLAALKAYVEEHTEVSVVPLHAYLQIAGSVGIDVYNRIAENSWAGEALFAALLFPEQRPQAERVFRESLGHTTQSLPSFESLLHTVEHCCEQWLQTRDWSRYLAVGFSLCFNQLLASLFMATRLKKLADCPPTIFGGSLCVGPLGRSLLRNFPQIDYIVDGEGETPLAGLCRLLTGAATTMPDRILCRTEVAERVPAPEISDLDSLPTPEYTPYFDEIKAVFPDHPFIPVVPMEFSRGCWWNRCTFCNLNLQWRGYRHKSATKLTADLELLTARHQCLDYTFTDNALPPREADRFFERLAKIDTDYRFFAEIRAIGELERLASYRRGGLDTVQVGIEALSSSLLRRMEKGVRVIDNVAIMKLTQTAGIHLEGNLIVEFPGSTVEEVADTLDTLEYLLPFRPLSPAVFFLGTGSPAQQRPRDFGITATLQHRKNRGLFPADMLKSLELLARDYRGDRELQRRRWRPVTDRLARWRAFHDKRAGACRPALAYRNGGTFLLIRQEQPEGPVLRHRLQGTSRAIYLFCEKVRGIDDILARFEQLKQAPLLAFLNELCRKRLMFREGNLFLSLAVRES